MPAAFKNETAFREWICSELEANLSKGWQIMLGKNVADILVSWQDTERPLLVFIEVKYRRKNHGRIGIGDSAGSGYQMEYLLYPMSYLEKHLRWVVGDEKRESALILSNKEVRKYAAAGLRRGKQNNLQNGIFNIEKERLIPIADLPARLVSELEKMVIQEDH